MLGFSIEHPWISWREPWNSWCAVNFGFLKGWPVFRQDLCLLRTLKTKENQKKNKRKTTRKKEKQTREKKGGKKSKVFFFPKSNFRLPVTWFAAFSCKRASCLLIDQPASLQASTALRHKKAFLCLFRQAKACWLHWSDF